MSEIKDRLTGRTRPEEQLLHALLDEARHLAATQTELVERLAPGAVNHVLDVATVTLDADGVCARSYGAPAGSVLVNNPTAHTVTVVSGSQTGQVGPTVGIGVQVVPATTRMPVAVSSTMFTLYGTAADVIGIQVFTGLQAFGVK